MKIQFVCGHAQTINTDKVRAGERLQCPECGDTRRASVSVPAPRFTAVGCAARGPLVRQQGAS